MASAHGCLLILLYSMENLECIIPGPLTFPNKFCPLRSWKSKFCCRITLIHYPKYDRHPLVYKIQDKITGPRNTSYWPKYMYILWGQSLCHTDPFSYLWYSSMSNSLQDIRQNHSTMKYRSLLTLWHSSPGHMDPNITDMWQQGRYPTSRDFNHLSHLMSTSYNLIVSFLLTAGHDNDGCRKNTMF